MDLLKKSFLVLVICAGASGVQAQQISQSPVQRGFTTSYFMEMGGEYNAAAEHLMKIYESGSYEMNLRLGWLYYKAEAYAKSADFYRKAVDLLPKSVEARMGYVLPLAALNKWDEVEAQYKELLKFDPYNSTVNYRLGLICYNRQDYSTAKPYFEAAISAYPFDYDIVGATAWNYLMLNEKENAKKLFNRVLLIAPNDEYAIQGLLKLQ